MFVFSMWCQSKGVTLRPIARAADRTKTPRAVSAVERSWSGEKAFHTGAWLVSARLFSGRPLVSSVACLGVQRHSWPRPRPRFFCCTPQPITSCSLLLHTVENYWASFLQDDCFPDIAIFNPSLLECQHPILGPDQCLEGRCALRIAVAALKPVRTANGGKKDVTAHSLVGAVWQETWTANVYSQVGRYSPTWLRLPVFT